jgi:hypothetical protein
MKDQPNPITRREFLSETAQGAGLAIGLPLAAGTMVWMPVANGAESPVAGKAKAQPAATQAAGAWLAESPFNLLVDYYTEVPFRPYGSGATRENVLKVLKELQPGYIIIYAKGHSGRTSFPSSLNTQHEMLGKDMPAFFRQVTRETGTRLFLYYSGMLDGIAGTRHPEWGQPGGDGKPIQHFREFAELFTAYAMCPRSGYWGDWVAVHLREMMTRYDPDGIWVDGDWAGPCACPRCRKDPWAQVTDEWRTKFRNLIKSFKPSCLYSAGNVGARREYNSLFDWRSGDWFSPNNHRLHSSIAMRRYTNLGVPYDAFTCDTVFVHSRPHIRARIKPLQRMLQEGATVLANGGLWGYWTYPMPHGAFVPSKMHNAKLSGEFARARKDVCLHTQSARWTAVLDAEPRAGLFGSSSNFWGAAKALIALHRSPDVIDEGDLAPAMTYDLIVVPEQPVLAPDTVARLEQFVRRGGKLLSSGNSIQSAPMQSLLGVRLAKAGETVDGHVMLKAGGTAGVYAPWDHVELAGAEELYPLFRAWDDTNPQVGKIRGCYPITGMVDEENPQKAGFPAATVRRLGKGIAVHVATTFFDTYWKFGNPDMLAWLREILPVLQPAPLFQTDALSFVEASLRQKGDTLLVHLVNGNPGRDISLVSTDDLWVDDIPPVGPITCRIRCASRPQSVTIEPGGTKAATQWRDGILEAVLPRLEIHSCLAIRPWQRPENSG